MKSSHGFSLIELLIVISIIGVLGAISIPMYKDYIVKTKWQTNVTDLSGIKTAIRTCMLTKANVAILCDTLSDLKEYGYQGAVLPTPKYSNSPVSITANGNIINLSFTGSDEVSSLVYDANFSVDSAGNAKFTKTSLDTLGKYFSENNR